MVDTLRCPIEAVVTERDMNCERPSSERKKIDAMAVYAEIAPFHRHLERQRLF